MLGQKYILCLSLLPLTLHSADLLQEPDSSSNEIAKIALKSLLSDCDQCTASLESRCDLPELDAESISKMSVTDLFLLAEETRSCPDCLKRQEIEPSRGYVDLGPPIGYVPDTIPALPLYNLGLTELSSGFSQLTNLQILILDGNNIQPDGLDSLIGLPKISLIDLTNNGMTEIPTAIGSLPTLSGLNLGYNDLKNADFTDVSSLSLTLLSLEYNNLVGTPASLATMQAPAVLHLDGNPFDPWQMTSIAGWTDVAMLRIGHCGLAYIPFPPGGFYPNLEMLFMNNNALGYYIANELSIFHLPNLKVLLLSNNNITTIPTDLSSVGNLISLTATHNELTTAGAAPLGSLPELTNLNINHNELTTIPSEWENLTKLKKMNLSHNPLLPLDETIPLNADSTPNLRRIDVLGCNIVDLPDELMSIGSLNEIRINDTILSTATTTSLTNYGFSLVSPRRFKK